MNASLQVIRAIPELQTALSSFRPTASTSSGNPDLTYAMANMYSNLRLTAGAFTPLAFLSALRQAFPQFGEMARVGKARGGYAQQDAEECYAQILQALQSIPGIGGPRKRFVEQYMTGEMQRE